MRRTMLSTLVTHADDEQPEDTRRAFAAVLTILDDVEGGVELSARSAHLNLSPEQVAIMRDVFFAAASGQDLVMYHSDSDLVPLVLRYFEAKTGDSATMSSQEVADMLNVSRPYVVKLARSGELPHTKVGNRHRFKAVDVLAYTEKMGSDRETALRRLVPEGGYTAADF